MTKKILLFSLICVLVSQTVFSQADSLFLQAAFPERTASNAGDPVYNGRQHVPYSPSIEGIPYYLSDAWHSGTLVYQDNFYTGVFLKYDLVADEVVIRHLNTFTGIVLFTQRIHSFTLGKRVFTHLATDGGELKGGLYEVLGQGSLTMYAKRSKRIEESIVGNKLEQKIATRNTYFILKDGRYTVVKNQKDMLSLTGEKKEEIKAWLKASGIRFKSDPEATLIRIVEHYNQTSR